jgi:hypothetical protein
LAAWAAPAEFTTLAAVVDGTLTHMVGATPLELGLGFIMERVLVTAAPTGPVPAALAALSDPAASESAQAGSAPAAPSEPLTFDILGSQYLISPNCIQSVKVNRFRVVHLTKPLALSGGVVL